MFGIKRAEFEATIRSVRDDLGKLADRIERSSTAQIRADLDNLTGRVEALSRSMQQQFGRLYAERGPKSAGEQPAGEPGVDGELADLLEFQRRWNAGEGTH